MYFYLFTCSWLFSYAYWDFVTITSKSETDPTILSTITFTTVGFGSISGIARSSSSFGAFGLPYHPSLWILQLLAQWA